MNTVVAGRKLPPGPPMGAKPVPKAAVPKPAAPRAPAKTAAPPAPAKTPRAPVPGVGDNGEWNSTSANVLALLKILSLLALRLRNIATSHIAKTVVQENWQSARALVEESGIDVAEFQNVLANYGKADVLPLTVEFAKQLRAAVKSHRMFMDIRTVTPRFREILDPLLTALSNPASTASMTLVGKRIANLKDQRLASEYTQFVLDTTDEDADDDLEKLVQDKGGDGVKLTPEQLRALSASDPAAAKEYRRLRNQIFQRRHAEFKAVVQSSGKNLMPIAEFLKKCDAKGLPTDPWHPTLRRATNIFVNTNGDLTDANGSPIVSASTGKPVKPNVEFELGLNPDYVPGGGKRGQNWILYSLSPAGTKNYLFTKSFVTDSTSSKFDKVSRAIDVLDAAKVKWRRDVFAATDDDYPRRVLAMLVEFMYITTCRPGAKEGMTAGNRTFGAMNFLARHVRTNGQKALVQFPIKSGKIEKYLLDPSQATALDKKAMIALVQFLTNKIQGKDPDEIVFTSQNNRVKPNALNAYLKSIGLPITAHKIRTVRGTKLAKELLSVLATDIHDEEKKAGGRLDNKYVQDRFIEVITQVGKLLSHVRRTKDGVEETTWLTAARAYVDLNFTMNWFADLKYMPPKQLAEAAKAVDND